MKNDLTVRLQSLSREWFIPGSPMSETIDEAVELIKNQRVAIKSHVKRTDGMANIIRDIGESLDACARIT